MFASSLLAVFGVLVERGESVLSTAVCGVSVGRGEFVLSTVVCAVLAGRGVSVPVAMAEGMVAVAVAVIVVGILPPESCWYSVLCEGKLRGVEWIGVEWSGVEEGRGVYERGCTRKKIAR